MHKLKAILVLVLLVTTVGCNPPPNTGSPHQAKPEVDATTQRICEIAAELFRVKVSDVKPTTSLADLDADQLDLVELVMELEEQFNISITDKAITDATGDDDWQSNFGQITMDKLTQMVTDTFGDAGRPW